MIPNSRLHWLHTPRWVVVAGAALAFAVLTQVSLDQADRPAWLGLRGEPDGESLVVSWVQPAGLAWDAGIRPGYRLLAVDGRSVTAASPPAAVEGASTVSARAPDGSVHRASADMAITVSRDRALRSLLIGACWFVLGSMVFLLAAERVSATGFLAWGLAGAVSAVAAIGTPFGGTWALGIEYVSVLCGGTTLLLLSLVFPVNRLQRPLGRWLAGASLFVTAALVVVYLVVVGIAPAAYAWLQRTAFAVLGLELMAGVGLLLLAFVRQSPARPEARRAIGLITLGTLAAVAPFVLLTLLPPVFGGGYILAPDVSALFVILAPASVGFAVVTREILGISRVLSRGLVALVVWLTLLGAYSLGFDLLRQLVADRGTEPYGAWYAAILISVAVVAGTFPSAQYRLRRRVDQLFFHDGYSYSETLRELGGEIVHVKGVEAISQHVLDRLVSTVDLMWAVIALDCGLERPTVFVCGECSVETPEALPEVASLHVPLVAEGATIGALAIGPRRQEVELSDGDRLLVSTLAPLVATALQNALLMRRLEDQVAALGEREQALEALNVRLMEVQEEERQRIALDLHDDPLQRAILLARQVSDTSYPAGASGFRQTTEEIIVSLRAICTGLHPPVLDDFGLVAGLERLVNEICARSELAASLTSEPDGVPFGRLDPNLEVALYRVAQEALNNCLKHAEATRVTVCVGRDTERVWLRVVDDGRGCNGAAASGRGDVSHLGILGMRERLRPWGGVLKVEPGPAAGTVVSAHIEV